MNKSNIQIKIQKLAGKFHEDDEFFYARVNCGKTLSFDEVAEEIVRENGFRITPTMMKMYLEAAMDTIVNGVMADGRPRRFGDYFTVGLKVAGRFKGQGDKYDSKSNKMMIKLRPLKGLNDRSFSSINVRTVNRGAKVELKQIASVSTPDSQYLTFGEDFIITGSNIILSDDAEIDIAITEENGAVHCFTGILPGDYEADGHSIRFSWKKCFPSPSLSLDQLPCQLMVSLKTRGVDPNADMQKKTIRTFFKDYVKEHPDARIGNYKRPL